MSTITLNEALENLGIYTPPHRGEFQLEASEDVILNDDGVTWTKIPNMTGSLLSGFSVSGGTLTKTVAGGNFLLNGVSDLEVNKACTIFYGLVVNGSIVSSEITEHTFSVQAKVENISITSLATLALNDTIEIWAKGDGTTGITLTTAKLDVTFLEA